MNMYQVKGQWNVICPVCGFKKKSGEMLKRWDGVYVCKEDWEIRHPQDFLRVEAEDTSVPYSYGDDPIDPDPIPVFIAPGT